MYSVPVYAERRVEHFETKHPNGHVSKELDHLVARKARLTLSLDMTNTIAGTGWANAEFRTYIFEKNEDEKAFLKETEESKLRRKGVEKPLSDQERAALGKR